jgi:transposase
MTGQLDQEVEMPVRPLSRGQAWLMPPSLDQMIPADHPVRFAAAFVDQMDYAAWHELGVQIEGAVEGGPSYHAQLLLSVWIYGFMTGVRSSRRLEIACREQLPFIWLCGQQTPDHNTLWRFYKQHRQGMRKLLKRTVQTAVVAGFIDLALQAVDGSKVGGNAAKDRTFDRRALERLLQRTDAAIDELEAQNRTAGEAPLPRLPAQLERAQALRERVQAALEKVKQEEAGATVNLTDEDAVLVKGRHGFVAGYNAQAVASPLAQETGLGGMLITAADVTQDREDHNQLLPMLQAASDNSGQPAKITLADAGYHSGPNLSSCREQNREVLMPEAQAKALTNPYHKDAFVYDAQSDSYRCPRDEVLHFVREKSDRNGRVMRQYRAPASACRACPAFGACTRDRRGRSLEIGPDEEVLREHRQRMAEPESQAVYAKRKELIEPTFGIMKEQQGARRFLLKGLEHVRSEWMLLAVAFNLRTLAKLWRGGLLGSRPLAA